MKPESTQRERTPAEIWDQLAISQVKNQLAPNGFKKIHNGKREVSAVQFLSKKTVNTTCVITANIVRLYRENLRERIDELIKERDQWRAETESKLKACRFWEILKKLRLKEKLMSYAGAGGTLCIIKTELDSIKPKAVNEKKRQ